VVNDGDYIITISYEPNTSAAVGGRIFINPLDIMEVTTNSPAFLHSVQWALTLPHKKQLFLHGSPTENPDILSVDQFEMYLAGFEAEPDLLATKIPPLEVRAQLPEDLRKAMERRRERQARLQQSGLRTKAHPRPEPALD
jgi:hypothetical protein